MEVFLVRKLNQLHAAYSSDLDKLHKLPSGDTLKCKITRPRNLKHHCKYWAMINMVFDNLPHELEEHIKTIDDLHYELKLQTGLREKYTTIGGQEIWRVQSISFDKMSQDEFSDYYDKCLVVVSKYILPGITTEEIVNQLIEF